MNLSKNSIVQLFGWKSDRDLPLVFRKEARKAFERKQKEVKNSPEKNRIKVAVQLIKSDVYLGSETIDDVFVALKLVGLKRTKEITNIVYEKAYASPNICGCLSENVKFRK